MTIDWRCIAGASLILSNYRFNHREKLAAMFPVLACAGARTKPMPY
jgi:hypothetical protein